MRVLLALTLLAASVRIVPAAGPPREISFATADGGTVVADVYGDGSTDGVVLAHGAAFDKESWRPLAETLAAEGHRVLALDFRGHGRSRAGSAQDGLAEDLLAAVGWLRHAGLGRVAIVGASLGGRAAAEAAAAAPPGEIDRVVLLSPAAIPEPEQVRGATLLVASAEEPGVAQMKAAYARTPGPRRIVLLPGSAHAQHIFETDQAAALTTAIVDFLGGR